VETHYIACSLEQRGIIDPVIERLNAKGTIQFKAYYNSDDQIIRVVLTRDFGLVCPTSEISLQELETQWEHRYGPIEDSIFAEKLQFGVTPVVFFMPVWIAEKYAVFEQPSAGSPLLG
jgi:hypothetical protein